MTDLPLPLTPADCDLRGLPFMPLDVARLMDSNLYAISTGDEFKAAVSLWCKSWTQTPAASLPNSDKVLAHLSGAGPKWQKVKTIAMHGWVLCSDGRLYHPVVAELAIRVWNSPRRIVRNDARLGVTTPEWAALRRIVFARDDFTCRYCGERGGRLECDHVLPIAKGGGNELENLATSCFSCNRSKGSRPLAAWRH